MKPLFTFFAIILIFSTITVSSQTLSWQEKEILKQVDEDLDAAKDFLIQVVNVNSGTMNHEGVRKVGKLFGDAFNELSMKSRWVSLPDSVNRAGHLVVEKVGGTGKKLLLIGHLDTVFEEDSPFQKYEPIGDGKAKAPGGQDMKGGDVVILYALKALHDAGMINDATITVVMTGDEEKPGRPLSVSREALIEAGKRSDIALGFEGGRPGFGVVARRSSSGWKLEVEGTRSHSSRIFSENVGSGAIFEVARILNGFHEDVKGEEFLTFNPGVILGGTMVDYDPALNKGTAFGKTNVVAQTVVVQGGIRTISMDQLENTQEKMKNIVENGNLPGTSASISFTEGYPPMSPTEENRKILAEWDQVSRDLGYGPVEPFDPGARGAADVSFVSFIPGIDGLGMFGEGAHTPQEIVDMNSLELAVKRAAILIYRLTR
jgi:glutamate carboxypeptidase